MKRSQINYVIDKAHAIAQTFRVCLPEFAYFTVDDWLQLERDNWQEVVDLQLGWDITDFGSGDFEKIGLFLFTLRNGNLKNPDDRRHIQNRMLRKCCRSNKISRLPGIFTPTKWKISSIGAVETYACSWPGPTKPISVMINESLP